MKKEIKKPYRPCVVAVIVNDDQQVLVGERLNAPGSWQFPQGGIDQGESAIEALRREVLEETGCQHLDILKEASRKFRYDFPKDFPAKIAKEWAGQEQVWYLCRTNDVPDVENAKDKEFGRFCWMDAKEVLDHVIFFKKMVYHTALVDLGCISSH